LRPRALKRILTLVRRISLSLLAGVALLGATLVVLHATSNGLSQPTLRTSAQLVAVAPAGLHQTAPRRLVHRRSGLKQTLGHLLATESMFTNPAARRFTVPRRSTAIQAAPHIQLPLPLSRTCPVATGSNPGGCSIVPCAVYVASAATSTVTSGTGLGLAVLPSITPRPAPGGKTPAGTCVSRPGRPPQMRWVSSAYR
jgi:hypothetical protein